MFRFCCLKQKTAYEWRISDWSSDVCSSDVDVDSEDFGALLAGLGYGGRMSGGDGEAHLDATWPGSPAGFRLVNLQGRFTLAARDGQLVRSEEHKSELQSLMRISYAVYCLKKKTVTTYST